MNQVSVESSFSKSSFSKSSDHEKRNHQEDPSKDKEKGLLKDLVIDLESINTEEANKYLMRLKKLVKKEDGDIYEWTINEEKKFK